MPESTDQTLKSTTQSPKKKKTLSSAKKFKASKEFKAIRKDLMDDLNTRGLLGAHYEDKVNEYMRLWCHLQMLAEDIDTRGVFIEYSNGATQRGTTENKSLSAEVRVSGQMLSIWNALGFKDAALNNGSTVNPTGGEEDDEL